ncbi:hypothetical protein [Mesorhizobium sp. B2-4-5]|uniref:hypothetical protein n=1 Tax=Mesorhizobium sp. B2-4-5 TaxID=2589944 RepID=UPI00112D9FA8|nr:hypothetical protein [Mesorhizobium sp. B2-4-5]TPL32859.1 hypothetical protein FJ961_29820 [Mesorhizobium sp. B2-4-5]
MQRIQTSRAAIEATFLLRHRSFAEASHDLLRRLHQSQNDDTVRPWEDADPAPLTISAFDADILRAVFRDLVSGTNAPECQWRDLAKSLVLEYVGCVPVEVGLVDWIISK